MFIEKNNVAYFCLCQASVNRPLKSSKTKFMRFVLSSDVAIQVNIAKAPKPHRFKTQRLATWQLSFQIFSCCQNRKF
jgi:hypothetical protein